MSRDTPTFTATGGFSAPGVVSAAAQGQSLTAFSQRVAQIGQKVFRDAAIQRAQNLGEVAGLQENFKPKPAFTDAQRVFNATAINAHKQLLVTDITRTAQQMSFDIQQTELARDNPSATHMLNAWNTQWSGYMQQTLANAPEGNKAFAFNYLNAQGAHHQLIFQNHELMQDASHAKLEFAASDSAFNTRMQEQAATINYGIPGPIGFAQRDAFQNTASEKIKGINRALLGGLIGPEAAERDIEKTKIDARNLLIFGQYRERLAQGTAPKFIQTLNKRQLPNASSLWAGIAAINKQAKLAQAANLGIRAQRVHEIEGQALRDGRFSLTELQWLKTNSTPDQFNTMVRQLQINIRSKQGATGIESLNPIEQDQAIAKLQSKIGGTGEGSEEIDNIKHIVKLGRQSLINAPADFNQNNPNIRDAQFRNAMKAPLTQRETEIMGATGQLPLKVTPDTRTSIAQLNEGRPWDAVRYLLKNTQRALGAQINSAKSITELHDTIATLQKRHPGTTPKILTNLQADGFSSSGIMYFAQIEPTNPWLPQINEAFQTNDKDLEAQQSTTDQTALKNEIIAIEQHPSLGSRAIEAILTGETRLFEGVIPLTFGLTPSAQSNLDNYISSIAAGGDRTAVIKGITGGIRRVGRVLMVGKGMSAQESVSKATNFLVGKFNYTSVGGQTIRHPKDLPSDVIRSYLGAKQKKDIRQTGGFPYDLQLGQARNVPRGVLTAAGLKSLAFTTLVDPGHWANTGDNLGVHWILGNQHVAMVDTKGHELIYTFADMRKNSREPEISLLRAGATPQNADETLSAVVGPLEKSLGAPQETP